MTIGTQQSEVGSREEVIRRTATAMWPKVLHDLERLGDVDYAVDRASSIVRRVTMVSPTAIGFTPVDPRARETALGPMVVVAIPPAPTAPAPAGIFDPAVARQRTLQALDDLRRLGERCRQALRHVAATEADEVDRLLPAVTLGADAAGRTLDNDAVALGLARRAAEARALARDFADGLVAAQAWLVETTAAHRSAVIGLEQARSGEASVAGLPRLDTLGEVLADRLSAHEQDLDALAEALDRLERVQEVLVRLAPLFTEAAERHARATLHVVRAGAVARHAARLAGLAQAAEAERVEGLAERTALEACRGLALSAVPRIVWPAGVLLDPPRLEA